MPYIGKSTDGFGVRNRFLYLASASDTSVSGADANGATLTFTDGAYVDVYLNGVLLKAGTDYNTNTANTIASIANKFALCAVDGLPKSFKANISNTAEINNIISIIFLKHF